MVGFYIGVDFGFQSCVGFTVMPRRRTVLNVCNSEQLKVLDGGAQLNV
jgi:hypothetical protein